MNWNDIQPVPGDQYYTPPQPQAAPQAQPQDITIFGPDGAEIHFPVGTDPATIQRAMDMRYPQPQTPSDPNAPGDTHAQRPLAGRGEANLATQDFFPSLGTGIAQGAYELGTLPATVTRFLVDKSNGISNWLTGQPLFPDNGLMQPVFDLQDQGREWMGDNLHQPTTTAGEFARTVGEFVPGAVAFGPGGVAGNALRYGVIPGVASEAAGQVFDNTPLEPYVRAAAGILTGGLVGITASAGAGATQVALARSLRGSGITDAELAAAQQLIADGASRGIQLTWPEALHTATNGRVDATMLQSFVEQARGGQPIMSNFMSGRPAAAVAAGRSELDNIGAQASPTALGGLTQELADDAIRYVREQINAATRPLYNAAAGTTVDPIAFGRLFNDPLVQQAIKDIRASPVYGREVAGMGDDSVAMMQALKVYFEDLAGKEGSARANFASSVYGSQAAAVRDAGTAASPDYANWLQEQSILRRDNLAPLQNGPVGVMAGTNNLGAQTAALFPRNPFAGTAQETGDAIATIAAADPAAATSLVRAHVEQVFDQATRDLTRGNNQFGAARFVAELKGNSQQAATLEAAVRALPDGDARWAGLEALMRVFQATGSRLPANSRTAFNTAFGQELTRGTPLGSLGSLLLSPGEAAGTVRSFYADFRLGRNSAELARIITDPASGPLLQRLAMGGPLDDMIAVATTLINQAGGTIGGQNFNNTGSTRLGTLIPPSLAPTANVSGY